MSLKVGRGRILLGGLLRVNSPGPLPVSRFVAKFSHQNATGGMMDSSS